MYVPTIFYRAFKVFWEQFISLHAHLGCTVRVAYVPSGEYRIY